MKERKERERFLEKAAKRMDELLFPRRCPVCGEPVKPYGALICPPCEASISLIGTPCCAKCGKELSGNGPLCRNCMKYRRSFCYCLCLMNYDGTAAEMMAQIKYKHKKEYIDALSGLICRHLGDELLTLGADALVPVPVHKKRLRARGYNQAEELAKRLSWELSKRQPLPLRADLLFRRKNTKAQKELSAGERLLNLQEAFYAKKLPKGIRTVIVVDDIYTTGMTMESCTRALLRAGAERVYGLCVCAGRDV